MIKLEQTIPAQFREVAFVGLGWEKSDPTRILQSFVREHFRIHYVTRGAGWLETKQQAHRLTEGSGFVIFPGEASNYYPDRQDPWEYFWLGVKGRGADELVRQAAISRAVPVFQITNSQDEARANFVDLYASIIHAQSRERDTAYYLYRFFCCLESVNRRQHGNSYYFEQSLHYIHENYMNPISILDLASYLAIDRTYLFKLFKSNIDCSPQAYLISHRVSKACDLLLSTKNSVSEIAYSVGFNDLSDFSKQFKKRTGMTATDFRQISEQKNNFASGVYF